MGLSSGMCCKSVGSKCGGCPYCDTVGVYKQRKTTYPGMVRYLDRDVKNSKPPNPYHLRLREMHKTEFAGISGYENLWDKTQAARQTVAKANASADAVLASLKVLKMDILY